MLPVFENHLFSPFNTLVIHNPVSGRGVSQKRAVQVVQHLDTCGYRIVHTQTSSQSQDGKFGKLDENWKALICVGGDGTLFNAITEIPSSTPIGFFPCGTINLLAKSLSIPELVEPWLALLKKCTIREVYFGQANGRPFASVGSVGFDAKVVFRVPNWLKKCFHEGAYAIQAVLELPSYNLPRYRVTLDGKRLEEDVLGVLVGKGPYFGGPYPILEGADHGASLLRVGLLRGNHKRLLLRYAVCLARGTLGPINGMDLYTGKELLVESEPFSYVELDGEPYGTTPVIFTVESIPRRVLAPK